MTRLPHLRDLLFPLLRSGSLPDSYVPDPLLGSTNTCHTYIPHVLTTRKVLWPQHPSHHPFLTSLPSPVILAEPSLLFTSLFPTWLSSPDSLRLPHPKFLHPWLPNNSIAFLTSPRLISHTLFPYLRISTPPDPPQSYFSRTFPSPSCITVFFHLPPRLTNRSLLATSGGGAETQRSCLTLKFG